MKRSVLIGVVASLFLACSAMAGQRYSHDINIRATVPSVQGLNIAISRVRNENGHENWTSAQEISFDDLEYDDQHQVFLAKSYYVVDVGVNTNAGDWTLTYSATSIVGPNNYKLDYHVNITAVKQKTASSEMIGKIAYGDALGPISFSKSDFSGGYWLRIYYGIATGDSATDAPNTSPITTDVPAGTYTGTITITLTTS